MNDLKKKWLEEGEQAITIVKNTLDMLKDEKRRAALDNKYEDAALARENELKFKKKIIEELGIKIEF